MEDLNQPVSLNDMSSYTDDLYSEGRIWDDKNFASSICQFNVDGNNFFPCGKTVVELPNGYYRIRKDYTRGVFLTKMSVNLNKLVLLESSSVYNEIVDDIIKFWESKEKYIQRGRIYRRNILLHSAPGMGKTSLINLMVNDLILNRNGFVLSISEESDITNFNEIMQPIRMAMPEKPIIAIIEDIDNFVGSKNEIETELLNILDGIGTFSNILTIATTNYPEKLSERYINRPSRFNRVIEVPYPDENTRREFLIKTNLKEDIDSINLDEWVAKTDGYSIDFLKELSDSVFISGNSEEKTFELLDSMIGTKQVKNQSKGKGGDIGFITKKQPQLNLSSKNEDSDDE